MIHFTDRRNAGQRLAMALSHLKGRKLVVIGLAPGGMIVAEEVAHALDAPLDVILVQDIEAPFAPDVMIAAAAPDASFIDNDLVHRLGVTSEFLSRALVRVTGEVRRHDAWYREQQPPVPCADKTVILVDDGLATSVSMRAAIASIRRRLPSELIVAAPVRGSDKDDFGSRVDAFVCLSDDPASGPVSGWYDNFPPIVDEEVVAVLRGSSVPSGVRETPANR